MNVKKKKSLQPSAAGLALVGSASTPWWSATVQVLVAKRDKHHSDAAVAALD